MADGDDDDDDFNDDSNWRRDLKLGAFFGAVGFAWQAVQGQYAVALVLFVSLLVLMPIYGRFRAWSLRSKHRTRQRAAAWARSNPAGSKRLRWVVFPVIGLLWALILWRLFG